MWKVLWFVVLIGSVNLDGLAQAKLSGANHPKGCEENNRILEAANEEAGNSIVLLIGYNGRLDKNRDMRSRRLYSASAYLTDYLGVRTKDAVVTGKSDISKPDFGLIEIYIKGRLYSSIWANPGYDIGLGSCDSLESDDAASRRKRALLYPWRFKRT